MIDNERHWNFNVFYCLNCSSASQQSKIQFDWLILNNARASMHSMAPIAIYIFPFVNVEFSTCIFDAYFIIRLHWFHAPSSSFSFYCSLPVNQWNVVMKLFSFDRQNVFNVGFCCDSQKSLPNYSIHISWQQPLSQAQHIHNSGRCICFNTIRITSTHEKKFKISLFWRKRKMFNAKNK